MPDREKVIKCLKACTSSEDCAGHTCPYWDFDDSAVDYGCRVQMEIDALVLLDKSRPARAIRGEAEDLPGIAFWFCPSCRIGIDYLDRFCRHCGQEMKWE